jgi:multicomponent Na+:H+ antiporter subunit A
MTALVLLHAVAAVVVLTVLQRRPLAAAVVGCAVLVATAIGIGLVGIGAPTPRVERWPWVDELGLAISLRLDGFAVMMVLVVAILGALVLAYSYPYFGHDQTYGRFVGIFILFAGAMTGLVLSDDLFTMFVFWELTSVCSFLLIGLNDRSATARAAALRALLVTSAGGLCLLGGIALFQTAVGTSSFSELAALRPSGTLVTVASMLCLAGAFTKSAQFPFHFWLPGAMAAPTPVSAYLHSATMVKAGIVLMARLAPVVGDQPTWRWTVVIGGSVTMLLGGMRAMRQTDAKLLLAHSTVSQLGFLTILVGLGVPGATYAGVAHLLAHAIFKAGLFLGVGVVDHAAGTRDIRRLQGLGRQMPVVTALMVLSAASMAGLIPLLGFATKEKALVALLDVRSLGVVGWVALVVVAIGSVLSAAYSVRLIVGLFGTTRGEPVTQLHHGAGWRLATPVGALAIASLLGGLGAATVGGWLESPARSLDAAAEGHLYLWPGFNTALVISLAVVTVGCVLGALVPIELPPSPIRLSGERIYQWLLDGLLDGSRRITVITQSGSLLAYLGVVMTVVAAALAGPVLAREIDADLVLADSWVQGVVVVLAIALAFAVVVVRHRFVSALLLGGVGFACAGVFAAYGAPDLALTQVLVETLTIVVFLLVLRQMPQVFENEATWAPRAVRIAISTAVGVTVAVFALMVAGARTAPSAGLDYAALSEPAAGGRNVVNVILVDFRGTDTLGEITVLATAALGVTNLVRMARRRGRSIDETAP